MHWVAALSLVLSLTEEEWHEKLTPDQYRIMREGGTEPAYSGRDLPADAIFLCVACEQPLFRGKEFYDTGNGWPNFTYPIDKKSVYYREDWSYGFKRYEVVCRGCGSHLGHVFHDGPPPKYLRYCINSVCLKVEKP